MKTNEEIARESAMGAVSVRKIYDIRNGDYWSVYHERHPHVAASCHDTEQEAREAAAKLCAPEAARTLAAIEQAQCLPIPAPVSVERLAEIRAKAVAIIDIGYIPNEEDHERDDLLAHIDHLTRALFDCGQDGTLQRWSEGYMAAWRAGFAAGAEAQKEDDVAAARRVWRGDGYPEGMDAIEQAVIDAPLAAPPDA